MQQVFITISSAHNHKQDMRIDDYQERTQKLLSENKTMKSKLKSFVMQFINSDGEFECDFD